MSYGDLGACVYVMLSHEHSHGGVQRDRHEADRLKHIGSVWPLRSIGGEPHTFPPSGGRRRGPTNPRATADSSFRA